LGRKYSSSGGLKGTGVSGAVISSDRAIKIIERLFGDDRGKLAGKSADAGVFVQQDDLAGFLYGFQHGLAVEWQQGTKIQHFEYRSLPFAVRRRHPVRRRPSHHK
jgi:hypothetical protein